MNRDTSKIKDYPYQIYGMLDGKNFKTESEFFDWFNESADTCEERFSALFDAIMETALYEYEGAIDLVAVKYDTFLQELEGTEFLDYYTFEDKVPHFERACEAVLYDLADKHVEQFHYTWFMDDLFDMSNAGPGSCECLLNSIVNIVEDQMELELYEYQKIKPVNENWLPFENVKEVKSRIEAKNARIEMGELTEEKTKIKM